MTAQAKAKYHHLCVVCLNAFDSTHPNAKYCSEPCRKVAEKYHYKCKCSICGKDFMYPTRSISSCPECRKALVKKICVVCQKEFSVPRHQVNHAKCCSDECRKNRYLLTCVSCDKQFRAPTANVRHCPECLKTQVVKVCTVCQTEYTVFKYQADQAKYCSKCKNTPKPFERPVYEKKCVVCNQVFTAYFSTAKFCSDECRNKPTKLVCRYCKKEFEVPFVRSKQRKYCSTRCTSRASAAYRKGQSPSKVWMEQQIRESIEDEVRLIVTKLIKDLKKTGNHLNGTAIDYWNVSFSESIKEQVKKRDGYACRICKKDTDLHVHHRIKRKNGGDHSMENLITLCGSCHRAVETGDLAHAIRKCTRNAFMHYHIPVAKLEEKLNKAEERAQTRADLKEIFRLIAEDEKEDALVLLDRLIERYEG